MLVVRSTMGGLPCKTILRDKKNRVEMGNKAPLQ